jgi:hypothetical protein
VKPFPLVVLILFNVLWAAALSIYKWLETYLSYSDMVTLRFGLGAVIMAACWPLWGGVTPRGRDLVRTILMGGIVFVVGHRLQVLGNALGTAGNSSVLMGVEPLVTSVAAAIFLKERIGARRAAGFGLAMAGLILLNRVWAPDFRFVGLTASCIFMGSLVCEAAYSVLGKPRNFCGRRCVTCRRLVVHRVPRRHLHGRRLCYLVLGNSPDGCQRRRANHLRPTGGRRSPGGALVGRVPPLGTSLGQSRHSNGVDRRFKRQPIASVNSRAPVARSTLTNGPSYLTVISYGTSTLS